MARTKKLKKEGRRLFTEKKWGTMTFFRQIFTKTRPRPGKFWPVTIEIFHDFFFRKKGGQTFLRLKKRDDDFFFRQIFPKTRPRPGKIFTSPYGNFSGPTLNFSTFQPLLFSQNITCLWHILKHYDSFSPILIFFQFSKNSNK